MKTFTILVGFWFSLALVSCKEEVQVLHFSKEGISFDYPSTWKITEEEFLEEGIYYLAVEKKGLTESGILTLTTFDYEFAPEDYILTIQEDFESQSLMKNLVLKDIVPTKYNNLNGLQSDYEFITLGVKHSGSIISFNDKQKTIGILKQTSEDETTKNRSGFDIMESSFKIK